MFANAIRSLIDEVLKLIERQFFIQSSTAVSQLPGKKEQ
jgi:hypothetical protein